MKKRAVAKVAFDISVFSLAPPAVLLRAIAQTALNIALLLLVILGIQTEEGIFEGRRTGRLHQRRDGSRSYDMAVDRNGNLITQIFGDRENMG